MEVIYFRSNRHTLLALAVAAAAAAIAYDRIAWPDVNRKISTYSRQRNSADCNCDTRDPMTSLWDCVITLCGHINQPPVRKLSYILTTTRD